MDEQINLNQPNKQHFVSLSLTLGIISVILSIICCWTVYFPLITGSLSILFALLSRGSSRQMHPNAKAGLITGCVSIGVTVLVIISAFTFLLATPAYLKSFMDGYRQALEGSYGGSMDELFEYYDDYYNDSYYETNPAEDNFWEDI